MTRKILARDSGVSERYLAQLERGQGNISILLLRDIARALDLPLELLVLQGPEPPIDLIHTTEFLRRLRPEELTQARQLLIENFAGVDTDTRRNRIALIGDAAGTVDARTGEGLSLGFKHAIVLADAIEKNHLRNYQRAHRKISRPPELMATLMLLVGSRRDVRRRVLNALATQPSLFTFMLAVHGGAVPTSAPPLGAVADFFRRLVTAEPLVRGPVAR